MNLELVKKELEENKFSSNKIKSEILTKWVYYSELLSKIIDSEKYPEVVSNENKMRLLEKNGLTNTSEYKSLLTLSAHKVKKAKEIKEYIKVLNRYFPEALLVPEKDFLEILEKYDLYTNLLTKYKGAIPMDTLRKVNEYKDVVSYGYKSYYGKLKRLFTEGDKLIYKFNEDTLKINRKENLEEYYIIKDLSVIRGSLLLSDIDKGTNSIRKFPITEERNPFAEFTLCGKLNSGENSFVEIRPSKRGLYSKDLLIASPEQFIERIPIYARVGNPSRTVEVHEYLKEGNPDIETVHIEERIDPIIFFKCPYGFVVIDMFDDPVTLGQ